MQSIQSYKDLIVWQRGMNLVEAIYILTQRLPASEQWGLTSQMRRAAISVPSNIAEGQVRGIGNEFAHHLRISNGSRQEAETQVLLAQRLQYITEPQTTDLLNRFKEVGRLLTGLHRSVIGVP